MYIKNHSKTTASEILGFPILTKYCYLGIELESNGKIRNHIKNLSIRIKKLAKKLNWICSEMNIKDKIALWYLFINSLLRYSEISVELNKFKNVKTDFI
jgi:hypothetical protein